MRGVQRGAERARGRHRDQRADRLDPPPPAPLRGLPRDRPRDALLARAAGWRCSGRSRGSRGCSRARRSTRVSTGGGRFGPAAAAIGLCLSGVGAATCVMTGAIPAAAPLIAVVDEKPDAEAAGDEGQAQGDQTRHADAHAGGDRRGQARTPTPTPPKRTAPARPPRRSPRRSKTTGKSEFGFEAKAPKGSSTPAPVKATVSNVGGGGGSSGGGRRRPPRRAGSSGSREAEIMRAWRARMTSPACTTT